MEKKINSSRRDRHSVEGSVVKKKDGSVYTMKGGKIIQLKPPKKNL